MKPATRQVLTVVVLQLLIWVGLYACYLKDPFDDLRWGPVLYPPGSTLHFFGMALLLLGMGQVLSWFRLRKLPISPNRVSLLMIALIILNLGVLDRALYCVNRARIRFRPHPLLHHFSFVNDPQLPSHSLGIRYDEFPLARQGDELRVMVIGDSSANGVWVPYEDRFSSWLEKRLRELHPGRTIRIINAAMPGYTIVLGEREFRLKLAQIDPDFFIISFNNDVGLGPDRDTHAMPWNAANRLKCYLYESEIYLALRKILVNSLSTQHQLPPDTVPRVTPEEVDHYYSSLLEYSRRKGYRSVIVSMPLPIQAPFPDNLMAYKAQLAKLAQDHDAVLVDCWSDFLEAGWNTMEHFRDACHPNAEGHHRIGDDLLKAFEEQKLLEKSPGR